MEENLQTPEEGTEEETVSPLEESGGDGEAESSPKEENSSPPVDYRKKFAESTKEASILREQIKNLNRKLGEITKEESPSEAEIRSLYPLWDEMGSLERELAIKNIILERRLNKVSLAVNEITEEKKWNQELERFLERIELTNSYPELNGKEKEFRKFALKPSHKGVSLDVLVKAFLYSLPKEPATSPQKGSLVERGSGGGLHSSSLDSSKGYTPEELAFLRKNDPKKYREVLEKGEINIDNL